MQRTHDRQRVAPAVEEVRITEGDVARAEAHQAVDIAHDSLGLDDPDAAVIDRGHGAVPAAVHAPVAGLHVADQPLLSAHRQAGVALQSRQQLAGRELEAAALQVDDRRLGGWGRRGRSRQALHPGAERRLILARDRPRAQLTGDQLATDRRVQPVEADRQPGMLTAYAAPGAERQPHRGVHRHREADRLRPLERSGVPRLHAEIQAADLVPGATQRGRRGGDVQRLVAQLIGRDQQDSHG